MAKTPLIQPPRKHGATLYVFPSAQEDIGLNLNFRANSVSLSHYALLNIPQASLNGAGGKVNRFLPIAIKDHFNAVKDNGAPVGDSVDQPGWHLAASLQNYMMNFETVLLNQESYDFSDLHTVSERAFWKWLKETTAIRWKIAGESNASLIVEDVDSGLFNDRSSSYKRVVKCIGAIDSGNSAANKFGVYNETYVTIPTSYGAGPVFFKCIENDGNYVLGKKYTLSNTGSENYLEGRNALDNDSLSYLGAGYNMPFTDKGGNFGAGVESDACYHTGTKQGATGYNSTISVSDGDTAVNVLKSNFDGIEIAKSLVEMNELKPASFEEILSYDTLNTAMAVDTSFDFNAILLYYSVYDINSKSSTDAAINLFGIVFLDSPVLIDSSKTSGANISFEIPGLAKSMSNERGFGSGFSFRVNIKTNSVYDNTDALIADYTTSASTEADDFNGVVKALNSTLELMRDSTYAIAKIKGEFIEFSALAGSLQEDVNTLRKEVAQLRDYSTDESFNSIDVSSLTVDSLYNKVYLDDADISLDSISNTSTNDSSLFKLYKNMNTSLGEFLNMIDIVCDKETLEMKINPDSSLFTEYPEMMVRDESNINCINYSKFIPFILAWMKKSME